MSILLNGKITDNVFGAVWLATLMMTYKEKVIQLSTAEHLSQQCGALSHRMWKFEPPVAELYTTPQFKVNFISLFRAMAKLKWLDIEPLRA